MGEFHLADVGAPADGPIVLGILACSLRPLWVGRIEGASCCGGSSRSARPLYADSSIPDAQEAPLQLQRAERLLEMGPRLGGSRRVPVDGHAEGPVKGDEGDVQRRAPARRARDGAGPE